tara:strand:+ start:1145 stop:2218 length:1074 start_codon:yes stop_codon:yes gene_type:complete
MKKLLYTLALLVSFSSYGQSKKEIIKKYDALLIACKALADEYNAAVDKYNALYEKHSVSFENPDNYAKSLFKLLKNKNKAEASKLLLDNNMSEYFSDKLNMEIQKEADKDSLSTVEWFKNLKNDLAFTFDKVYYGGINLGVNWQKATFQKTEFKIEYSSGIDHYALRGYKVFFKSSNKDYYFTIGDAFIINDKPINWELGGPYDIQAEKEKKEQIERERKEKEKQRKIDLENKPYKPSGLRIRGSNWSYRDKTFSEFRTKIVNNTDHYVNRVKFRLSIYTGAEFYGGTKSFSKTYDLSYYVPKGYSMGGRENLFLEPGDIQEIQIQELRDFFLGEDLSNQKNWYIKTEVLDVYPKHN